MNTNALKVLSFAAALAAFTMPAHAYTVYISNEKGNSLTVIDSETLQVLTTIPVGQRPRGIILTKDGRRVIQRVIDAPSQLCDALAKSLRRPGDRGRQEPGGAMTQH